MKITNKIKIKSEGKEVPDYIELDVNGETVIFRKMSGLFTPELNAIQDAIIDEYKLTFQMLKIKTSKREYSFPRQISLYLMNKFTNLTQMQMCLFFGQTHGTVSHAIKIVQNHIDTNKEFRERMKNIIENVENKINHNKKETETNETLQE